MSKKVQIETVRVHLEDSIRFKILDFIRYAGEQHMNSEQTLNFLK
jgi:anionic cell wall polymer biosynthesis LytR-Cps2A-Psr (LCP) family protein